MKVPTKKVETLIWL